MDKIKKVSLDEYEDVVNLSQFAFQYRLNEAEIAASKERSKDHTIYGYYVDEKLAGKVHTIPLEIYLGGEVLKMGGIASVATWPEYRRQGIAKKLIYEAIKEMDEAGVPLSYLHPFNAGFYRKLGWELAFDQYKLKIPTSALHAIQAHDASYVRRKEDLADLKAVYNAFAQQYNGMLKRSDHWWENRVMSDDKWHKAVSYNAADEPDGYLIYAVEKNNLHVRDYAYSSTEGKRSIFKFLANHDSMAVHVHITLPKNELIRHALSDVTMDSELNPYFMARIVNVPAFFEKYPFKSGQLEMTIRIQDDFYAKNSGLYTLIIKDGHGILSQASNDGAAAHLEVSIQMLTASMLGYHSLLQLLNEEWIKGESEKIAAFQNVLAAEQTFLPDFF